MAILELDVTSERFARLSVAGMRSEISDELERAVNGGELDKLALDMLGAVRGLRGSFYTNGELLDLMAIVLEAWRALEL
jgi:hypothetical protein